MIDQIDILSLIEPPEEVWDLKNHQQGRELLRIFYEVNMQQPEFFGAVASMAGIAMPTRAATPQEQSENEGKRLFAIELLAMLKVAQTPIEGTPENEERE